MDEFREREKREEEEPKRRWGRAFLRRLWGLLLTAAVVLGVIGVVLLQNSTYLDRARRWLAYGEGGDDVGYAFASDPTNSFGQLEDLLVVVNQNSIQFLRQDGTALFSHQVQMSQPALDVGGDYAVAYDIGGRNLVVAAKDQVLLELTLEEGYGWISARLNEEGWLTVVSEKSGYKGAVTVYNDQQEPMFTYNSSSRFLMDAQVSADCKTVLVEALGQEGGSFCTQQIVYELDKTEPSSETLLLDHLFMDLHQVENTWISVSDKDISFTDGKGTQMGEYTYGGLYLRQYSLGGSGFIALLLNRYQAGSIGTLVTVDESGEVIASMDVTQEVLDISACGNYLAVLMSNSLVVYDRQLQEYSRLTDTDYASRVLMESDGSALVIGGSRAFRYLP